MCGGRHLSSDTHGASLDQLILHGVLTHDNPVTPGAESDKRRAPYVDVVTAGNEGPDFPSHASVNFDDDEDVAVGLILTQGDEVEGSHGHVCTVDEWRPDVDLVVTLIRGRDRCAVGNLLVLVADVGVKTVVVDPDLVVGIPGRERDLEVGGEKVRDGGVEGVNGDVLEDEGGLGRTENCPDYEYGDENYEQEDEDPREYSAEDLPALILVVVTHFYILGVGHWSRRRMEERVSCTVE